MSGRFHSTAAGAGPQRAAPWWGDADAALLRFIAALALSCLLHAALVFLPFLGESSKATQFTPAGRRIPVPEINATLAPAGEHKYAVASVPAKAQDQPYREAEDRPAAEPQPATRHRAEGADLLPLAAPLYYSTDQLTKRPQPLASAELDVPEVRPIVASGKMVLTLYINEFGLVADAVVEKSELPEVFSRTAVAAFKGLRFQPGERMGQPVATVMRIEVAYDDGRVRKF